MHAFAMPLKRVFRAFLLDIPTNRLNYHLIPYLCGLINNY
jgi:hypothetical protein